MSWTSHTLVPGEPGGKYPGCPVHVYEREASQADVGEIRAAVDAMLLDAAAETAAMEDAPGGPSASVWRELLDEAEASPAAPQVDALRPALAAAGLPPPGDASYAQGDEHALLRQLEWRLLAVKEPERYASFYERMYGGPAVS